MYVWLAKLGSLRNGAFGSQGSTALFWVTKPGSYGMCRKEGAVPGLVNIEKNDGKSPLFMGKLTISMAIFNSYVTNYQRLP